jgi:hypothetical protein
MRWVLGVLVVVALATLAPVGLAQPSPPALSLVYDAPASCAPQAEFEGLLRGRLGARAPADLAGRTLRVQITPIDGQFSGRLSLVERDGRFTTKTLSGRDCGELVDALSLVAALAVQSDDAIAADHESPPLQVPASAPTADERRTQAPATVTEPHAEGQPPRGAPRTAGRSRFGVELGGLVAGGPAPAPILSGIVGLDWALDTASLLSPAAGVGFAVGAAPEVTTEGGTATFAWWVARVEACALRVDVGHVLRFRGCLLGDWGTISARGSHTFSPASSSRTWFSVGAASNLEFPLGARFAIHLVAGIEAPLRRDRYAFGTHDFFDVPFLVVTGSAAVAVYLSR